MLWREYQLVPSSKLFQKALLEIVKKKNWGHYTKLTPNDIVVKQKKKIGCFPEDSGILGN